jgi:hypothetical protein
VPCQIAVCSELVNLTIFLKRISGDIIKCRISRVDHSGLTKIGLQANLIAIRRACEDWGRIRLKRIGDHYLP